MLGDGAGPSAGPSSASEAPSSSTGVGKSNHRKAKRGRGVSAAASSSQPGSSSAVDDDHHSDTGRDVMETDDPIMHWPCTHCTFLNTYMSSVCEMCEQPRVG